MSFTSYAFLILLAVVLVARLTIGKASTERRFLFVLGAASMGFYAWHIPSYLLIIMASAGVDFFCANKMHQSDDRVHRKRYLILSIVVNLGMLAWFKYTNFALSEFQGICAALGFDVNVWTLRLILPMGISFYTFQSMSYTIDVYRKKIEPLKSIGKFFLYVSFFPQLVAGPIVRASEFIYQLDRRRRLNWLSLNQGLMLIIRGFFLKLVCADNIGPFVDRYWSTDANSCTLLMLAFLFSCQIFCDFAGYSSIARGLAYLLGFRFPVNFRNPYLATSFSNFWQRWHITLSQWLRDYLYIPLGGNRGTRRRTYINLMLVMLLGGLWHGASITFILWGALHGGALAIEKALDIRRRLGTSAWNWRRVGWFAVVQATVLVSWILFRCESGAEAWHFLAGIANWQSGSLPAAAWWPMLCATPVLIMHLRAWLAEQKIVFECGLREQAALAGAMVVLIMIGYGQSSDFMYFQF